MVANKRIDLRTDDEIKYELLLLEKLFLLYYFIATVVWMGLLRRGSFIDQSDWRSCLCCGFFATIPNAFFEAHVPHGLELVCESTFARDFSRMRCFTRAFLNLPLRGKDNVASAICNRLHKQHPLPFNLSELQSKRVPLTLSCIVRC